MAVCITGMHRSGTSMVAQGLEVCGLFLGEESALMRAAPDNPDGFWEHTQIVEINEAILSHFGGGWDWPPRVPEDWSDELFSYLTDRARGVLETLSKRRPFGWKDPRTSLALPFWQAVCPDLHVVLVVRNPLEVALSLHRRNHSSLALGLALWHEYNSRVVACVPEKALVVAHYSAFFQDPEKELRRLGCRLGLPEPTAETVARAGITASKRHTRYTARDLQEANVNPVIIDLYAELCRLAGWEESDEPERARLAKPRLPQLGDYRDVPAKVSSPISHGALGRLDRSFRQEELIRELQGILEERTKWSIRQRERIRQRDETIAALQKHLREQEARLDELFTSLDEFNASAAQVRPLPARIRLAMRGIAPDRSNVLVITHGDDALLQLGARQTGHFPQTEEGSYAGYHPESSEHAVAHLEELRLRGANYLVIPGPSLWWLDHYEAFRDHLDSRYVRLWDDADCVIFRLDHASTV
jgi:hypothetical protein